MRATIPVRITPAKLQASTATAVHTPAAYNPGIPYGFGAIVHVAADYKIYESLQPGNEGNTPGTSPLWWRVLGPTETPYSAATTYPLGATVSANERVYESRQAGNLGKPLPVLPAKQTDWWIDAGPTNRAAMFDLENNRPTVVDGPLVATFKPGQRVNSLGVTGMKANRLKITATSVFGGGTVYGPYTIDLNTREAFDAYEYAFKDFSTRAAHVVFDIPPLSDIVITVELTADSGNVKCGGLVVGNYIFLGEVRWDAENDARNFSTVDRGINAEATMVARRSLPLTDQTLELPVKYTSRVLAARAQLNGIVALYSGLDDPVNPLFDMLLITGFYTKFKIAAPKGKNVTVHISLEEI